MESKTLEAEFVEKANFLLSPSGNNILWVGMYGPKGPCEEVFIKHTGRNNYNVNYLVRERGDYVLIVKWGDDHIPGSPFKIDA
jgi:filamin